MWLRTSGTEIFNVATHAKIEAKYVETLDCWAIYANRDSDSECIFTGTVDMCHVVMNRICKELDVVDVDKIIAGCT